MEIFSSILEQEIGAGKISFIPKCKGIRLTHLIFADDLTIFPRADTHSLGAINRVLDLYSNILGLYVNREKSTLIFAGTPEEMKLQLLRITGFSKGHLPMKYLGVPLVAGKLPYYDCGSILDKIKGRLAGWKTRPLSYAG